MLLIWLGFLLSITLLILISRRSFWVALIISAILLGLFSLSALEIYDEIVATLTNPSILLLAFSMGIIPLIGGTMEKSGLMDLFINNLRIKKNLFLAFSSALMGMLPMPGGALLSAPIIKKGGTGITNDRQAAINIWFRHILVLIYPFGALLPTTKMAGINVYEELVYLAPGFFLMLALGYIFLLRGIRGTITTTGSPRLKRIFIPLGIILIAPVIHITLITLDPTRIPEIYLLCGVSTSLALVLYFGKSTLGDLRAVILKMRPWKYALIIIGMFIFLNIFKASDTPSAFEALDVSKTVLLIIGFILGFATGRVELPVSILLPIYFSKYGVNMMAPVPFSLMFFSVYAGYVISPVHPCVVVSIEYFHTNFKKILRHMLPPAILGLTIAFIIAQVWGL